MFSLNIDVSRGHAIISHNYIDIEVPMVWFTSYLDANIDSYKSLNFVGVPNAFALMLLIWITLFTMRNEEAESSLSKIISEVASVTGDEEVVGSMAQNSGMEDEF